MENIYRSLSTPRFEVLHSNNSHSTQRYYSDSGFMRAFERNSIEDALSHFHSQFKSDYTCAVYIDENWRKYWLEKVDIPQAGQLDHTITKRRPVSKYPSCFSWLK